jgi:hypothetical protein
LVCVPPSDYGFYLKQGVAAFNRSNLKHAETVEKDLRPNAEVLAKERKENEVMKGVEGFDKAALKPTETVEKNVLPDKETIAGERRDSLST